MEIINTEEIINYTWGWSWIGFIAIILGIIICIVLYFLDANSDNPLPILVFVIGLGVGLTMFSSAKELPPVDQYQVIFKENLNINEILNKYDIIEQRGSSFIVQEKMD